MPYLPANSASHSKHTQTYILNAYQSDITHMNPQTNLSVFDATIMISLQFTFYEFLVICPMNP